LVQYELEVFDATEEADEKLQYLKSQIRRNEADLKKIKDELAPFEKRLAKVRRALAGIAKLKAAKRLPLP
jgi:septal ring factor EnvC (AmiA/AmiB activator)